MPTSSSTSPLNSQETAPSEDIAISVQNVSKAYRIWKNPSARLKAPVWNALGKLIPNCILNLNAQLKLRAWNPTRYYKDFFALKDISFEVKKGEALGIIGRNGSGKSTLLQIIAGTLTPSAGKATVQGRLAALLELGSGFNPDFTGRENVYLNAATLGLSSKEIADCYSEIVAFADIGDFIDQPVKTYSSGMMVRLAFAVQCAVKPDILIIDEALSVGDVGFRNKCLERIQRMRDQGMTTLFVSHDLGTLQLLCNRVVWIETGKVVEIGDPCEICQNFFARTMGLIGHDALTNNSKLIPQQSTGKAAFTHIEIDAPTLGSKIQIKTGEALRIAFRLKANASLDEIAFAVSIYRTDGDWLIGQSSREAEVYWPACKLGETVNGRLHMPKIGLAPGDYVIAFAAYDKELKICYALTDLTAPFSVRSDFPIWGKVHHPCVWLK